jgi:hypothetical protein
MVILGSEAELHSNGVHLLLRTYFSEGSYAYMVHNLHGGMPVICVTSGSRPLRKPCVRLKKWHFALLGPVL